MSLIRDKGSDALDINPAIEYSVCPLTNLLWFSKSFWNFF